MRFDAYSATFVDTDAHQMAEDVQAVIEGSSPGLHTIWEVSGAKHGYAHAVGLMEDTDQKKRTCFAILRYGGNGGTCNVEVKGEPSPAWAEWCRQPGRAHKVSRAHVCIDLSAPGLFEAGDLALTTISEEHRLKTRLAGDWKRGEAGRTLYLGSSKSAVQLRWYEKGKQLIGEGMSGADPNHCRLEIDVKGRKQLRTLLSTLSPDDVWGLTEWTTAALRAVSGIDAERVALKVYRRPDHERAMAWMLRQYGPHLLEEVRRRGGWVEFGRYAEKQIANGGSPEVIREAA